MARSTRFPTSPRSPVRRRLAAATLIAGAFLLGGCATLPGMGGYPVGGYPDSYGGPYGQQYGAQVVGTVQRVDRGYNRIVLVVEDGYGRRGQQVSVQYDQRTRLIYQGREHPVQGLERGDVIRVDAVQSGREWWARTIEVVRNVRDGGGYGGGGYGNELRGTVDYVDPRARMIRLDGAGYGSNQVGYDSHTIVEYQGRRYRPENLQRGDLVRVQARRLGNNQWIAERILVERSVGRY